MKKIYKIVALVVITCVVLSGCVFTEDEYSVKSISRKLGVDIESGEVLEKNDSHGGFHGDGLAVIKVKINDTDFESKLLETEEWTKEMNLVTERYLYGYQKETDTYAPYLSFSDEHNKPLIPKVDNAYYFMKNRSAKEDHTIFNVTFAVYDVDNSELYYIEYDM